jgi:outer membrane protein OmpA-like peptidoglycan-associated protein/tetratricopeptide (TPR) repeat protein
MKIKILTLITSLLLVLFLFPVKSYARDRGLWKDAEKSIAIGNYEKAIENYKQLYANNPDNENYAFKLGFCYLHSDELNDLDIAIDYLSMASGDITTNYKERYKEDQAPVETEYYLGIAYRLQGKYEMAITHFKKFKTFDERNQETLTDNLVDREIASCEYSMENPPEKYQVKKYNFDVDIPEGEVLRCPVISGNDSVFVYTLGTQNIFPPDLNNDREMYQLPVDDIFYSVWEDGSWTEPTKINNDIKLSGFTMPVSLSYDGSKLLLVHDDKDDGNIYMAEFKDGKWKTAKKLNDNINTGKWESHAVMTKKEDKLYFTSERSGGTGGLDLYVSERNETTGNWGEPESLGETINTDLHEETPFLLERENQLYFGSEGHGNTGGFDMFVSVFDSVENKWDNPLNLGYPYNTVGNDLAYIVSFQGKFIYCPQNSNKRREGISGSDCFSLRMPYEERLVKLNGKIFIPELNNNIPSDINIAVISEESGDTVNVLSPQSDGKFTVDSIPVGKITLVAMSSESIQDETVSVNIPVDFDADTYPLDIYLNASELALNQYLAEQKAAQAVVINPVYFEYNKSSIQDAYRDNLNTLAGVLTENDGLKIAIHGHTDHKGSESFNLKLGQERADAVKAYLTHEGVSGEQLVTESFGESMPVARQIEDDAARQYNRRVEFMTLSDHTLLDMAKPDVPEQYRIGETTGEDGDVISIKQVLFDFDSYYLKAEYRANLVQLAQYLNSHPDMKVSINGHCDHFGTDSYNRKLGDKRAQSIADYLIRNGVDESQVDVKSFGEAQPIAKEISSDRARQYNRRAEIEIIGDGYSDDIKIHPLNVPASLGVN